MSWVMSSGCVRVGVVAAGSYANRWTDERKRRAPGGGGRGGKFTALYLGDVLSTCDWDKGSYVVLPQKDIISLRGAVDKHVLRNAVVDGSARKRRTHAPTTPLSYLVINGLVHHRAHSEERARLRVTRFNFRRSRFSPADLKRLLAFPPPGDPKFEESRHRRAPPPSVSLLPRLFVAGADESREVETPDAVLLLRHVADVPCPPFLAVDCMRARPEMKIESRCADAPG